MTMYREKCKLTDGFQPENLEGSGINVVLNTSLFAILGAISLHHGGEVAGRVAREKILRRLLL